MIALFSSSEKIKLLPSAPSDETIDRFDDTDLIAALEHIKTATHYRLICLDADQFDCSPEGFCQALSFYRARNPTPIVVIAQGRQPGDELAARLVNSGMYNLVTAIEPETFQKQFIRASEGAALTDVIQFQIAREKTPTHRNKFSLFRRPDTHSASPPPQHEETSVAIAGIYPRLGTTTQAIRLVRYLISRGDTACYVEANNHGHIAIIQDVFTNASEERAGYLDYDNIPMYYGSSIPPASQYNYIVYDYGIISASNRGEFNSRTIRIITAGSSAWEMAALADELAITPEYDDTRYLFTFAASDEQSDLRDFMETRWVNTYFADFAPDMFSDISSIEADMYSKIIKKL